MVSTNPAKAIGIDDRKGSIAIDITILDSDLTVDMTMVDGKLCIKII